MYPNFQLENSSIFIGSLDQSFPDWFATRNYSQVFVLVDENTQRHCLPYFLKTCSLNGKVKIVPIPAGESYKNLATCDLIWQAMLEARLDRNALAINLGGGVVGDMGGFCATTWKRGIDFIQIPTTLLAMTDAAIGGKTGIDFQGIKNVIGVFKQPEAVFIDPFFLQTLSEREMRSGYAEVLKHAMILSDSLTYSETITKNHQILQKSIEVKVRVVQEDPHEKGLRMLLNFGHTIGHALESWSFNTDQPLTHGEAVYIGMICEAEIAEFPAQRLQALLKAGQSVFPYCEIPAAAFPNLWQLILQDKKNSSGTVRIAVPDEMPYTLRQLEITADSVASALNWYNALGNSNFKNH